MKKFWNFVKNEEGAATLYLSGVIAEESWWGDEVTPAAFKADLDSVDGDIEVWINSPGGDCIAASQIYNMLMEHKGDVTVKVDGIAASAASVIAMAGTKVLMGPTSLMMIHNPLTIAIGDTEEMKKAALMLDEVKESIINAYEIKTGMARNKLSKLMDAETWLSAHKAMEYGFADDIMFSEKKGPEDLSSYAFSRRAVTNSLLEKLPLTEPESNGTPVASLEKRLFLIKP